MACDALLKLAAFTGEGEYRDLAEKSLGLVVDVATRYPPSFGRWLSASDFALGSVKQVAAVYKSEAQDIRELLQVVQAEYRPNFIVAASTVPPPSNAPALLKDRPLKNGEATVYICEGFVCKNPVTSVTELEKLL
jgi:uncharacterized protein YyaL (SSP411 family)